MTVTGPGGVGKTSLAMAAASQAVTEQARLVVCELAEVESPDAVRHAVAARLGGFLPAGEPVGLPTVSDDGSLLVLLDNCEHVLDAAADVADQLLASGPHVRVLTTSREPLGLPEEQVLLLNPLPVPESAHDTEAASAPSVLLFAERARRANPDFDLDEQTLPDVVRICRALDGIPLALEIAAARVRVLALPDIASRLGHRFGLLRTTGTRGPDRHRSLRAVVDWSYELLEPPERELLGALAVHPGGCDLSAATTAGQLVGLDPDELIDVLDSLVSKSLMTVTTTGARTRFGMLETLREYGIERLEQAGTLRLARDRHADYYAALAREVRDAMIQAWTYDGGMPLFFEFDNFRAALHWVLAEDASADRAFDVLAPLWYLALQFSAEEIADLAQRALARWPDDSHPRWSEVAGTGAAAAAAMEDYPTARRLGEAAVAAPSSPVGTAFGHCALADVAKHADDDPPSALAHLDQADAAAAAAGFEPLRCDVMGRRVQALAQLGRDDEALATAERALAMAAAQGNQYEHAWSRHLLGLLLVRTDQSAAREWLTTALADSRELSYFYGTNSALRGLATVSCVEGDLATSADQFSESLDGFLRVGHLGERRTTLAALLPLLVAAGRRESAATLIAGLDSVGAVVPRIHAPLTDEVRSQLAAELASSRVTARGRALSLGQLVALAHSELQELRAAPLPAEPAPQPPTVDGTPLPAELRHTGDLWQVTYAGTTVHLPDLRGLRDLAVLLAQPGREVAALDLATPAMPAAGSERQRTALAAEREGALGAPADLGEQLDAQARAAYTARIRELQDELDAADAAGDPDRAARYQDELDFIARELSAAYGLHGPRRAGDPAEKARSAVTARIRAAIGKVELAHPALGRHLERSVRTGRFCSYEPDEPVHWTVVP